ANPLHPAVPEPAFGGIHQDVRDFLVLDRVEETEEPDIVLVTSDVEAIDLRGATPDGPAVAIGGERGALSVLEEWVLLRELVLDHQVEGADVSRVASVDVLDHVQKVLQLAADGRFTDFNGHPPSYPDPLA